MIKKRTSGYSFGPIVCTNFQPPPIELKVMKVKDKNESDGLDILLEKPTPFEMSLPWSDDRFSRRFFEVVNYWGIPTEKEVEFIAGYLKPSARVLDLACGGGRHALALARMGYRVTGIEIGQYPLELARIRAQKAGLDIEFIKKDILQLEYQKTFDLAFLICGQIGHCNPEQAQAIFDKSARALVDSGLFIVHGWKFSNEDKASYVQWYSEKKALYHENPSVVHREQYYFEKENVKLVRDFAVDTVTREGHLFSVSEKEYSAGEVLEFARHAGLELVESFGSYDREPLTDRSDSRIFIFASQS